jgi:deoxyribodipyrimidine photo-lyase
VFTPYKRRWLETFAARPRPPAASERGLAARLVPRAALPATREVPTPEDYGLASSARYPRAGETRALALLDAFAQDRMAAYRDERDLPALDGTSRLSPHLRAGTIGIRSCVEAAVRAGGPGAETWLSELIWREFYQQILRHFPHVEGAPFLPAAAGIAWRDAGDEFAAWCDGRTGVPIVDAAMRQLNETAWMHNRLRMIVASYLTKHLLIDWRRGERYFALRLADADLAANNGGWQWSASTGTDAAPYFRVFNPVLQGRRFDPDGAFVKAMLPELGAVPARYVHEPWLMSPLEAEQAGFRLGRDYPAPLVDLAAGRERALAAYAPVLGGGKAGRVKS